MQGAAFHQTVSSPLPEARNLSAPYSKLLKLINILNASRFFSIVSILRMVKQLIPYVRNRNQKFKERFFRWQKNSPCCKRDRPEDREKSGVRPSRAKWRRKNHHNIYAFDASSTHIRLCESPWF